MNRKYLDDKEIMDRPDKYCPDDTRQGLWCRQREEYGFDERELWDLNYTFCLWLYERLLAYKEWVGDYGISKEPLFTYKDKKYSQQELIDMMITKIEEGMPYDIPESYDPIKEVCEIWNIVHQSMWW